MGKIEDIALGDGGDAALARVQRHVNAAFISMTTWLERNYGEQGHAQLLSEMSEHDKINALTPRNFCSTLNGRAHQLRLWWNAAKHVRGRWANPPSDKEVEEVVQGVMSELVRLGWCVCMYVFIETTAQAAGTRTCRVGGGAPVACRHAVGLPTLPLAWLGLLRV